VTNDLGALAPVAISFGGTGYTLGGNSFLLANATISAPGGGPNTIICDLSLSGTLTFSALPSALPSALALNGALSGSGGVVIDGSGTSSSAAARRTATAGRPMSSPEL
jgi:hypothetical protein